LRIHISDNELPYHRVIGYFTKIYSFMLRRKKEKLKRRFFFL